jgi:1-acyl-sn-glycerol-3-phosphate acyltransferase
MSFKKISIKRPLHIFLYRIFFRNFLRIIFGVSYKEAHFLKQENQFILVANHNSHMDTIAILSSLPSQHQGRVKPVAAADYFARNIITRYLTDFFINSLLISRQKSEGKNNAIEEMDQALKKGDSLIIFPEGSRGQAEVMQDFKHGVSILLKRNPTIPFIPMFLKGMGTALPKGDPFLIPTDCQIKIGKPVLIDQIDKKKVEEITEVIKENILNLNT